jgi:putative transposase
MLGMMSATGRRATNQKETHHDQRFKKLSHSLYECKYHIVFCPKYRYRIFKEIIGETVRQLVYQLCKQKEQIEVLELNVQPDHVHLVVSIPPKYSVSEFMGYLKGKMALRLFQQYESLGRRYWGRHLWARGYCVSTIGLDEEKIRKYVQWQEKQEKQVEAVQGKLFD